MGCSKKEIPTGIAQTDIEGLWAGTFNGTSLLGRSLSGDANWQFNPKTFVIQFFDPPANQSEQLSGDWKFDKGKMILTLKSSFPIGGDIGTTDSLFVSILNNRMSIQTIGGSNLILQKIRSIATFLKQQLWPNALTQNTAHPQASKSDV